MKNLHEASRILHNDSLDFLEHCEKVYKDSEVQSSSISIAMQPIVSICYMIQCPLKISIGMNFRKSSIINCWHAFDSMISLLGSFIHFVFTSWLM